MEHFLGTWKLVHNEDYDKFLRATGKLHFPSFSLQSLHILMSFHCFIYLFFLQINSIHCLRTSTGAEEEVVAVSAALKPVVTISQDDEIVTVKVKCAIGTEKMAFKLGKEFHSEKMDGRHCKVRTYNQIF